MRNCSFMNNGKIYTRISKKVAAKVYVEGSTVAIVPCNLIPFTPWHPEYLMNRKDREDFVVDEVGVKNDFANLVNSFEYYNCKNAETGTYAAFYLEEE